MPRERNCGEKMCGEYCWHHFCCVFCTFTILISLAGGMGYAFYMVHWVLQQQTETVLGASIPSGAPTVMSMIPSIRPSLSKGATPSPTLRRTPKPTSNPTRKPTVAEGPTISYAWTSTPFEGPTEGSSNGFVVVAVSGNGGTLAYANPKDATVVITDSTGTPAVLNGDAQSSFGEAVSLSGDGNTVVVSAPSHNSNNGLVRTFLFKGTWKAGPNISGEGGEGLGHGLSLSADGDRLAVTTKNVMYLFEKSDNSPWNKIVTEEGMGPRLAVSLSRDGKTLAVALPTKKSVRIYRDDAVNKMWPFDTIEDNDLDDKFRSAVSVSGDGLKLVWCRTSLTGDNTGKWCCDVRSESGTGTRWGILGEPLTDIGVENRQNVEDDMSLSSDGSRVAIAVHKKDANGGIMVGVVAFNADGRWRQHGNVLKGDASDFFGSSVSMSSDGTVVVVGARAGKKMKSYKFQSSVETEEDHPWFQGGERKRQRT